MSATTEIFTGLVGKVSGSSGIDFEKIAHILIFLMCLYVTSAISVSYTHLDVYKRQELTLVREDRVGLAAGESVVLPRAWPVSYTHLDVYKRQVKY